MDRNRNKVAHVGTGFAVLLEAKMLAAPYSKRLGSFSLEYGVNRIVTGMIIHASDGFVPALYGPFTPECAKLVSPG